MKSLCVLYTHVCACTCVCMYVVWEKIRGTKAKDLWMSANEEEYEDTEGNVFNKKTYEDLRRQGLL